MESFAGDVTEGLLRTLLQDSIEAIQRGEDDDTPCHRRETVRTIFAAIEGVAWVYRSFVRDAAASIDVVPPLLDMALTETTYAVTDRGQLVEQTRFVPVLHMVRLISRVAGDLDTEAKIDFSQPGWSNLVEAMTVRNRLTHPKLASDLEISNAELNNAVSALFWFLEVVQASMEVTQRRAALFLEDLRALVGLLIEGEPRALQLYSMMAGREET